MNSAVRVLQNYNSTANELQGNVIANLLISSLETLMTDNIVLVLDTEVDGAGAAVMDKITCPHPKYANLLSILPIFVFYLIDKRLPLNIIIVATTQT